MLLCSWTRLLPNLNALKPTPFHAVNCLADYSAANVLSAANAEELGHAPEGASTERVALRRALSFDGWRDARKLTERNVQRHSIEVPT